MTADTSAGPSPGQVTSEQTTKSNPADEQSSRTHGSVGTNLAAQPSTFATSVTGPDTSLASADPSLLLTPDAGTASTRILPPLAEDASTMSYHTTSPLPPLLPPHHFTSFNSGASSAMNTIAWTGHDSHWNLIENEEAIGAIPGVFEKDPQLEMDFILSLESPCRNHMEFLNRRALNDPEQELYCGHALMATCPPPSQVISTPPGQLYPVETYNLPQASLSKLLNLSRQLVTEGQITPIMAVQNIKCHALYNDLTIQDIRQMINELSSKIRCYGFGAVMEDFEFMDSLTAILKSKTSCADSIGMAVRAADRYKQMFGQKLAGVNTHKNLDGRYIGGGGVAGPGMPQVDEFLFV
ncbi:hypothetical protein KEM54_003058 [Ascosphaera aggregata]|nr:hypothetical protein KEM54_003058 [Ascosphaera aggregata]